MKTSIWLPNFKITRETATGITLSLALHAVVPLLLINSNLAPLIGLNAGGKIQSSQESLENSKKRELLPVRYLHSQILTPPKPQTAKSTAATEGRFDSAATKAYNSKIQANIQYPAMAIQLNWQGVVAIRATIDENGKAQAVVSSSSGYGLLDRTALKAVRSYSFPSGATTEEVDFQFEFQLTK